MYRIDIRNHVEDRPMDVKRRVLAARLSVRINDNKDYSKEIGLSDRSGFKKERSEKNVFGDTVSYIRSGSVF